MGPKRKQDSGGAPNLEKPLIVQKKPQILNGYKDCLKKFDKLLKSVKFTPDLSNLKKAQAYIEKMVVMLAGATELSYDICVVIGDFVKEERISPCFDVANFEAEVYRTKAVDEIAFPDKVQCKATTETSPIVLDDARKLSLHRIFEGENEIKNALTALNEQPVPGEKAMDTFKDTFVKKTYGYLFDLVCGISCSYTFVLTLSNALKFDIVCEYMDSIYILELEDENSDAGAGKAGGSTSKSAPKKQKTKKSKVSQQGDGGGADQAQLPEPQQGADGGADQAQLPEPQQGADGGTDQVQLPEPQQGDDGGAGGDQVKPMSDAPGPAEGDDGTGAKETDDLDRTTDDEKGYGDQDDLMDNVDENLLQFEETKQGDGGTAGAPEQTQPQALSQGDGGAPGAPEQTQSQAQGDGGAPGAVGPVVNWETVDWEGLPRLPKSKHPHCFSEEMFQAYFKYHEKLLQNKRRNHSCHIARDYGVKKRHTKKEREMTLRKATGARDPKALYAAHPSAPAHGGA